jgi:amidase
MTRRDWMLGSAASAAALGLQGCAPAPDVAQAPASFALEEKTFTELAEGLRQGAWSASGLAQQYVARIRALDRRGPMLGAVIELNPDWERDAAALDRATVHGPLHGLPLLVKDNIETAGRMMTTAGSFALEGNYARADAPIVARLRAAGALILGKTNLSEWANFRSSRSLSGWSGRGGQTRNPYALDRNPSGSSSGSGVAVAANLCAAAVGTETDGSIVSPAAVNGIVGIKPTVGLLSRTGIIPISATQDTAGPMARTVRDAALLLGVMAGAEPDDPATAHARSGDYLAALHPGALRGARLGVARQMFPHNPRITQVFEAALNVMRQAGAEIVDPADLPPQGQFGGAEYEVLCYEFKAGLNAYLARPGVRAKVRTLAGLIAYNERDRAREMPLFDQEIFVACEAKGPLTDPAYLDALAKCRKLSRDEGIDAALAKWKLDALIAPTNGMPWLIDPVNGDTDKGGCASAAAVAAYPHVTLPAGGAMGLPVGISFFGAAWSEAKLLGLAYAFEQLTHARCVPRFPASVNG